MNRKYVLHIHPANRVTRNGVQWDCTHTPANRVTVPFINVSQTGSLSVVHVTRATLSSVGGWVSTVSTLSSYKMHLGLY